MALMTQAEYARSRKDRGLDGGTPAAVLKAVNSGRIHYEKDSKLIDPDRADGEWKARTEPRPNRASKPQPKSNSDSPDADTSADYNLSRAKREFYQAELARLKAEKQRGTLVDAETVKRVCFEAGKLIRAGHEDIVSQLAPDLAPELTIQAVERILKTRLDKLDATFADRIENLDALLASESNADEDDE